MNTTQQSKFCNSLFAGASRPLLADIGILMTIAVLIIILAIVIWCLKLKRFLPKPTVKYYRKPPWVRHELIRIKAHAHESGCRAIADIFNRRFAAEKGITVGKTYVAGILRTHMADILNLRNKWKHRVPKAMPCNIVWGMDLTGIIDSVKKTRHILGIIDHGTRKCLSLKTLRDKASLTLLKILILTIEMHGKPKAIRTDNEAVFTSRLFRFGL